MLQHKVIRSVSGSETSGTDGNAGDDVGGHEGGPSAPADTGQPNPTSDLAGIASDLAASMPEVQEHAVSRAQEEANAQANGPTDKSGARFDPAVHQTGPDGKGVIGARGNWLLKRGRKAGTANTAANVASTLPIPPAVDTKKAEAEHQARIAGAAAAQMLFVAGRVIGGEEWAPRKDEKTGVDEEALIAGAFGDYFKAKDVKDIPPGAALAFVLLMYAGPRFTMPKTQERVKSIKARIVQWWVNRKLRKQGLKASVAPRGTEVASREV